MAQESYPLKFKNYFVLLFLLGFLGLLAAEIFGGPAGQRVDPSANLKWDFLGYRIHRVQAGPAELDSTLPAVLLIHGFGRSEKPKDIEYSTELWREQISGYIRENIGRPTIIVGNSLGGYASLSAGIELGELTAGVVLINAVGTFSEEQEEPKDWRAITGEIFGSALLKSFIVRRGIFDIIRQPPIIRMMLNQVYMDRRNVDESLIKSIHRPTQEANSFAVFSALFDIPPNKPLNELFSELKAPLLLLWGIKDPWIQDSDRLARFRRHAPPCFQEVLLKAGHCPHDEMPDAVNDALLR